MAGIEQTRDLTRVVSNKVASTKVNCPYCGISEYHYNHKPLDSVWISYTHAKSELEEPVNIEAKLNKFDAGYDLQRNLHHKLGMFVSYRQGEYELDGEGQDYYSAVGSNIDIDSWMAGLYHRYDKRNLWMTSMLYGGVQKAEITTDDGKINTDTSGVQFGASVEAGVVFEPVKRLTIEPSVRLGYVNINYDDIQDAYGKTAEFGNISNAEIEAGVKVEKTFFSGRRRVLSKVYVKPSIIQSFGKGDVNVSGISEVEGVEDQTLARIEVGGSVAFGEGWAVYGDIGYTFGDAYDAYDANLGVNYSW